MKKLKLTVAALIFAFVSMACAAKSGIKNEQPCIIKDSIVQAAIGDSIFNIIKNAKTISADVIEYTDTTEQKTPAVMLSTDNIKIVKFLLRNPQNVASNDTVYGRLVPNICFTFQYKKQICRLLFDFGLRKWQVKDANDNLLNTFDLKSPEFVHLSSQLFPDDKYFIYLLNQ